MLNWYKIINSIKLSGFLIPVTLTYNPGDVEQLVVNIKVPDRSNYQKSIDVESIHTLSQDLTKKAAIAYIFQAVSSIVQHELREQFMYNNKRVFNPHYKQV